MMNHAVLSLISAAAVLLPAFIVVMTFYGFFHACITTALGDRTARFEGFLTLNPLMHIEIFGLVIAVGIVVVFSSLFPGYVYRSLLIFSILFAGLRWSHEIPVNANNFRNMKLGVFFSALAGTLGMMVLTLIMMYVVRYVPFASMPRHFALPLLDICRTIEEFAMWLCVLNLLPIPPFGGAELLPYLLSPSKYHVIEWLEEYSMFIFFALYALPGVSDIFLFISGLLSGLIQKGLMFLVF